MTRGTWHVTDVSNASRTLLYDLERGEWSDELCELFGVPPRRAAGGRTVLGRDRQDRPALVPRPGAADRRDRRRPAVRAVRADLLRRRRLQVHLRHRVVHPDQHRHRGGPLGGRPALDGGVEVTRGRADLRPRGRDLRDRRGGPVAARRHPDRRVRGRDRGDRLHRRRLRGRGLRAGADRPRRPRLGPARPRPDRRHHARHDAGAPRPGDARGDHVRGARRRRHAARRGPP